MKWIIPHFCSSPLSADKPPFVFVVTDFTSASLPFWAEHPRLKPLIQAGVLDLACFGENSLIADVFISYV